MKAILLELAVSVGQLTLALKVEACLVWMNVLVSGLLCGAVGPLLAWLGLRRPASLCSTQGSGPS